MRGGAGEALALAPHRQDKDEHFACPGPPVEMPHASALLFSFSLREKVPEGRMRAGASETLALAPHRRDMYEHFACLAHPTLSRWETRAV
jgi:hypothetical protein